MPFLCGHFGCTRCIVFDLTVKNDVFTLANKRISTKSHTHTLSGPFNPSQYVIQLDGDKNCVQLNTEHHMKVLKRVTLVEDSAELTIWTLSISASFLFLCIPVTLPVKCFGRSLPLWPIAGALNEAFTFPNEFIIQRKPVYAPWATCSLMNPYRPLKISAHVFIN